MYKVIYIPLDERTCNYKYPQILAQLSDDIELLILPEEYMGSYRQPADLKKVWQWVLNNIKGCDYGIFSIDALLYGNIINSRIHNRSIEECNQYLENLKKIKEINPSIEIHAYNLVPRVANYNNNSEEPPYWGEYGTTIWHYSYLIDKIDRNEATDEEKAELDKLKDEIPREFLNDFLIRREVNTYVNFYCLDLVEENVIDYLIIPKDDTAEYGLAARDHRQITKKIWTKKIMDRVMVYPGADEVGCIMFSRIFNLVKEYRPRIYIRYSSTLGPGIVPKYEDRPLHEGIKSQITAMGGLVVSTPDKADILLAVHSPGKKTTEAFEQGSKDITYYSYTNTDEFLNYINYYSNNYQKTIVLADTAFCNGSDNEFMYFAGKKNVLDKISSYCGWNTSQNTVGLALSHGCICSYYDDFKSDKYKYKLSKQYLMIHLIESWLYEANILPDFLVKIKKSEINPYDIKGHKREIKEILKKKINKKIRTELNVFIKGEIIEVKKLSFPWNRVFDIDFNLI